MGWGSGGGNAWKDRRVPDEPEAEGKRGRWGEQGAQMNDGMGPYGRPPENGFPLPEEPLWHGHAWRPEGVYFIEGENRFSDGYVPGPGDKPQF